MTDYSWMLENVDRFKSSDTKPKNAKKSPMKYMGGNTYNEMSRFIQKKHHINLYDVCGADKKDENGITITWKHYIDWHIKHYPIFKTFYDKQYNPLPAYDEWRNQDKELSDLVLVAASICYEHMPDGKKATILYQNFWHFLIDFWKAKKGKDSWITDYHGIFDWDEVKAFAKEEWQKKICNKFIKEFGAVSTINFKG